jgi:hypothetical protein
LSNAADRIELEIYGVAFTLLGETDRGPWASGWAEVPLPSAWLAGLPNGVYYVQAKAYRGGAVSRAIKPVKIMVLR